MRVVLALSLTQFLLFVVVVLLPVTTTHGMVARDSNRRKQQRTLLSEDYWKSSPATTSLQDHQRVQEILKNRHARRNPQLERAQSAIGSHDHEDIDHAMEGRWLSLPRRPKKKVIVRRNNNKHNNKRKIVTTTTAKKGKNKNALNTARTAKKKVVQSNGMHIPFELTLKALQGFHSENSHLVLPRRYPVPESDSFPSMWHGVDLAGTVYTMRWWQRYVQNQPDRVSELNRIGFVWERLQPEWNLILESLIVYKALNRNLLVPSTFVVPYDDDRWPKSCWGLSLGSSVYKIRNRGDYLGGRNPNGWSRREQLDALGFVWDVQELRFSIFTTALQLFRKIEEQNEQKKAGSSSPSSKTTHSGALKVPSRFVVPRSSRWPNELWGYRLGERCTQVRQKELYIKGQPHRVKMLADLGFYVKGGSNNNLRWLEVVHAAAVYSQMNNNELDVPTSFVVPAPPRRVATCSRNDGSDEETVDSFVVGSDDAWPWPEYLWGFPLGQRLRDIRVKGNYLKGENTSARRRQLDALGFNWEPKRGRRRGKN
mmetsp:Transcript_6568/g.14165  ORF Transcript_6568/g.14165 Transcript_6568/m.14165 type:complete len:539 (-) Transcript_6568:1244-2860(-)|eukprot:CAMPEP_0201169842 /NCGR_PEP_ID=MMETSP0851-20130426/81770_1 /ASSEMBLY_ACC=CAM_ASM_000631 /TAXON_ID=183588 /ORGANISM="Pseudo-nitzschia fraudulenta, Strain WWA7" /LENGTH=538 /DNA_ID=CAMNT_0047451715 /DNA_START=164 /DNA_END=1780 /DNA_ORIENTATION=+